MSSHGHRTGNEPEFRWVIGGKRSRLSLVRRLSLSFEPARYRPLTRGPLTPSAATVR